MRKIVLFLALFGVGLTLLVLLDPGSGPSERAAQDTVEREPLESTPQPPRAAAAPTGEGGESTEPQIELGGALSFDVFNDRTGTKQHTFVADVEHLGGGLYEARDLTIQSFDPDSSELRETIRAKGGRVRIMIDAGNAEIGDDGRVELREVEVTQHVGGPAAPITFRAPALTGNVLEEQFSSTDERLVEVFGNGLAGSGRGLRLDGKAGSFTLEDGGSVRFIDEEGRLVTFSTPTGGTIEVNRIGIAGKDVVEIEAKKGARLDAEGDEPVRVEAESMRLLGRVEEGGAARVDRATADGQVDATRGAERFLGDSGTLTFDADGTLSKIELTESPRTMVTVERDGGERIPLELSGDGPLTVELGDPLRFQLDGKSRLEATTEDVVIESDGGMRGAYDRAANRADFQARDNVRLLQGEARVETQSLDVKVAGEGAAAVDLTSTGETRLFASDSRDARFDVTAKEGMEIQRRDGAWQLTVAREVEVDAAGERTFRATAGELRDLDWAKRTFVAEKGATYTSSLGRGAAARAVSTDGETLELFGIPGEPAEFRVLPGLAARVERATFKSQHILVKDGQLDATDGVRAELAAGDRDLTLDCDRAVLTATETVEGIRPFELEATGVREIVATDPTSSTKLSCARLSVTGVLRDPSAGGGEVVRATRLVAEEKVEMTYNSDFEFAGVGERFTLEESGEGILATDEGRHVSAWGRLPDSTVPYEMTAEWIKFSRARVEAKEPHVFVDVTLLPVIATPGAAPPTGFTEARADRFLAHESSLLFEGDVKLSGMGDNRQSLVIETEAVRLSGDVALRVRGGDAKKAFERIEAWGGFVATYGETASARGDYMSAARDEIRIDGAPGLLNFSGYKMESNLIVADLERFVVTTERGILRASENERAWSLEFSSLRPVIDPFEGTLILLGAPVYTVGTTQARANGAVVWIHQDAWSQRGRNAIWGEETESLAPLEPPLPERDLMPNVFRKLHDEQFGETARSLYLEGDAEVSEQGVRVSRADAMYLDLESHTGWLRGAEVVHNIDIGSRDEVVRTRAQDIKTAADGSLSADEATITACDHDRPHYVIKTGDLSLQPRETGGWRISARDNVLRFSGGFKFPLPPIGGAALDEKRRFEGFETEEGRLFSIKNLSLGRSARFGTSVGAGLSGDIGKTGRKVAGLVGFDESKVRGHWELDASWFGSRGLLGTVGLELRERNKSKAKDELFWLDLYVSGIPDKDDDRGLVQIEESDRDTFRAWYRALGRYPIDEGEWIDLQYSSQSDPGVQPEFFQSEFTDFEIRDTYVHWRKALGSNYYDARVKGRIEEFRRDVEELPSAGFYRGAEPITKVGSLPLLYGMSFDVDYLQRREADERFFFDDDNDIATPEVPINVDIFSDGGFPTDVDGDGVDDFGVFADGFGDREVLRADSKHRLELPVPLGVAGIKATPFIDAELTAWDRGFEGTDPATAEETGSIGRAGLFAGVELASSFWKVDDKGFFNQLSPFARFRADVASEESEGQPLFFDALDTPLDGKEIELGLRTRWWKRADRYWLDIDFRGEHRYDRSGDLEDLKRLAVVTTMRDQWGPVPVGFQYDARYNTDLDEMVYSRSGFAFAPRQDLMLQVGYHRGFWEDRLFLEDDGLLPDGQDPELFEAASWKARWTASPKWEFELLQTLNIKESGNLNRELVVRRFSHDFVIEIGIGDRPGEGASLSIGLKPLLGWRPSRFGLLD